MVNLAEFESQTMLDNKHINLINMEFVYQTERYLYFVMPYISGGELAKYLERDQRFPEETVKFYAIQIIEAIGDLHKKDVIHRDLKLQNIMLDNKGYIKLIDFGVSKKVKFGETT